MRFLFSFAGGEGHLQPLLPVARAAARAGHDVLVTGAASMSRTAEAAGVPFTESGADVVPQHVPLQPVDMERERRAVRDAFAGWMATERAESLLQLGERWRPDVVVRDEMDFGAAVAAERLGLPHATVLVIAAGGFATSDVVAEPLARLRAAHGLEPDPDLEMLRRYLVLSPFAPSFRDPRDPLPATAHGFRAAVPTTAGDHPVVDGLGARPVVYVTLGTIFNTESGDLFARVVAGVGDLPVDVVVTVGRALDPADLGPQPPNIRVEQYVPQAALLPRCAAVVSHAGSGSVSGALAHGLPIVCVPMGADQPLNADRCVALGVGARLDAVTATPAEVRAAVSGVLTDPAYREAAARLRAEIQALPAPETAVALLERLATERQPITAAAGTPPAAGGR